MGEATLTFPADFLWGTATSSHQVEGGSAANDWWEWEQGGGGRIWRDQTSGAACEWWAGRAEEDIARMAALNTNAHRLSVEWSRIEPREGQWNQTALDRYRVILLAMRAAGVTPMITLHHFTNPLWVARRGGWLHPDAPRWFGNYARTVVEKLGDLCELWCTVNEPNVYASSSYLTGEWPPGGQNLEHYFRVARSLLLGHAAAFRAIRETQPQGQVGLAKHIALFQPRSSSLLDRLAARFVDHGFNGVTLEALKTGRWRPLLGRREQLRQVAGTLDWIGLNYYTRQVVSFSLRRPGGVSTGARPGAEHGPEGWGELHPAGILEAIRRLDRTLGVPIYITENGLPDEHDTRRPSFLLESLREVWRAASLGCPVMGYFFWSLVDNFEWAQGYDPAFRFGLYGVDFETQARTLRKSGELYAEIAGSSTLTSDMVRRYAPQALDTLFPGRGPVDLQAAMLE
jgi:beta-glucosidase